MNTQQLANLLMQFINAQTWADSKALVEANPLLLTQEADALLAEMMANVSDNEQAMRILAEHRQLLARCRSEGIEAAFADRLSPLNDISPELHQRLMSARSEEELMQLLQEHPELFPLVEQMTAATQTATSAAGASKLDSLLRELQQPAQLSDLPRHMMLCRQGLTLVSKESDPVVWGWLQFKLGHTLLHFSSGNRADNLEQAIFAYQEALTVMTRQAMPIKWATIMNNLAITYYSRIRGERAANIEQATRLYKQALQVRSRQAMPIEWAITMNNLANAYADRIRGERADNIEQAIQLYQEALQELETRPIQWAATMNNLAEAYHSRIRGERADNIEQATRLYQQALQVRTRQSMPIEWAATMNNLAIAYYSRIRGEWAANIERAIELYQQVLQVRNRQVMPIAWAETMMNLANAYSDRIQGSRADNIEQAIDYYEQARQVFSRQAMPIEWAQTTNNLALAYATRIYGQRAENLEQAIELYEQALNSRRAIPVHWAETINNLALAYVTRIRGERADNLEQAIDYYEQALQVFTHQAQPVEWASTINNLANAYYLRIRGERADNIEQATRLYEQALQVRSRHAMPREWSQTMNNLALAYSNRSRGERADNLEQAIEHYKQALEVRTRQAMPVLWAETMMNLASAYRKRIRGSRADNIEQAIHYLQEVLQVTTRQAMPVEWATTMMNLANAYYSRIRGGRAANIEQAIHCLQEALQVRTRQAMPVEWATTMMNLANAYYFRIRGERAANIEQAIHDLQEILQVRTRQTMPLAWADTMNNLALAYLNRIRAERAANIEQAIHDLQEALTVRTRQAMPVAWADTMNNLALAYANRIRGERTENIEQAIRAYQEVLTVRTRQTMPITWAETMNNLAIAYSDRTSIATTGGEQTATLELAIRAYQEALEIQTLETMPNRHSQIQYNLAHLYFNERHWEEAYTAIAAAMAASELLYQASSTVEARQLELREVRDLPAHAAYCLARLGRLEEAVTTLEQGKARTLSEALTRQEAVLESAPREDQEAFTAARERIRELEAEARAEGEAWARDFLTVSTDLREARSELSAVVARIRQDVPEFMPEGLDWATIKSVANTLLQPLVYLLTTLHGSLALIVSPNQTEDEKERAEVEALWFDDFQTDELDDILYDQNDAQRYLHGTVLANTDAEIEAFKQVLDQIWPRLDHLMLPIATHLALTQQAVLIPTGTLSLLPLHAICPQLNLTLAPSARALQTAKGKHKERATSKPTLLGIGNPLPNPKPLPFARLEVEEISPLFATAHTFYEKAATRQAVSRHIKALTHLHFSCHGAFNMQQPLSSALSLAGKDTLTLRDLLDSRLDLSAARLAVLSACQTGITDFQNVPDEAIGFPAGFLQAGVPGVISTLWPVTDISTALLLARFYSYHLAEGLALALALHKAQEWLREATAKELKLADYYKRLYQNARERKEKAKAIRWMHYYQAHPDIKPFAHPYYWAAFVFSGVG